MNVSDSHPVVIEAESVPLETNLDDGALHETKMYVVNEEVQSSEEKTIAQTPTDTKSGTPSESLTTGTETSCTTTTVDEEETVSCTSETSSDASSMTEDSSGEISLRRRQSPSPDRPRRISDYFVTDEEDEDTDPTEDNSFTTSSSSSYNNDLCDHLLKQQQQHQATSSVQGMAVAPNQPVADKTFVGQLLTLCGIQ